MGMLDLFGRVRALQKSPIARRGGAGWDIAKLMAAQNGVRSPLAPAAVRVERSRAHRAGERSDQTALTMWFGDGPALPGAAPASSGSALGNMARIGGGIAILAALAAATAYAERAGIPREKVIDAPTVRRRLVG